VIDVVAAVDANDAATGTAHIIDAESAAMIALTFFFIVICSFSEFIEYFQLKIVFSLMLSQDSLRRKHRK
jgi:hypothetical protein